MRPTAELPPSRLGSAVTSGRQQLFPQLPGSQFSCLKSEWIEQTSIFKVGESFLQTKFDESVHRESMLTVLGARRGRGGALALAYPPWVASRQCLPSSDLQSSGIGELVSAARARLPCSWRLQSKASINQEGALLYTQNPKAQIRRQRVLALYKT